MTTLTADLCSIQMQEVSRGRFIGSRPDYKISK